MFEVVLAVIGDVPTQSVVANLIPFVALLGPFFRSEAQVRRNTELVLVKQSFELLDDCIDFRTLHGENSFVINYDVYASVLLFAIFRWFCSVDDQHAFGVSTFNLKHFD